MENSTVSTSGLQLVTPEEDLNGRSNRWTNLTKVLVGDEKQAFVVHRHILEKLPFFAQCLQAGLSESQSGIIDLSLGSPAAFNIILTFIYHDRLDVPKCDHDEPTNPDGCASLLIEVYHMATFLMSETLANAVVDAMATNRQACSVSNFNHLYKYGLQDSKLMDLLLLKRAHRCRIEGAAWKEDVHFVRSYLHKSKDRAERFVDALIDPRPNPTSETNKCQWHVHETTPKCGARNST